jgi:hypothetical protein
MNCKALFQSGPMCVSRSLIAREMKSRGTLTKIGNKKTKQNMKM